MTVKIHIIYQKTNYRNPLSLIDSNVTQTTAGIVAGIFCAVIFIGVGMLRCFMTGMCLNNNCCNQQNEYAERRTHQREVVGTDESYTFQADFPPSYSTGIIITVYISEC